MRATTVPAQITTVEDKIVGELSITQLMLLVAPIFGGAGIFVLLPPFYAYAPYKMVLIVCLAALFSSLAIRIRGRIILHWLLILVRYNARPRYYLLDKNDAHLRDIPTPETPRTMPKKAEQRRTLHTLSPQLSVAEMAAVEQIIADPLANLHFRTDKKGALNVYITEVK